MVISNCGMFAGPCREVYVSALAQPQAELKKAYVIIPIDPSIPPGDLQFAEYATELMRALNDNGYHPAETVEKAEIVIYMGYAISQPQEHTFTGTQTEYGFTDTTSKTTATSGFKTVDATTHSSTYGPTGTSTTTSIVTTYRRSLLISAADAGILHAAANGDADAKAKNPELWRETVTSEGSNGDLREIMPTLIYAASTQFAQNSHAALLNRIRAKDENVSYIMTGERKK